MSKLLPSIKFLVDESVEYKIVTFLRDGGFNVFSISEESPSILDPEVLKLAYKQKRVLITNDKGFSKLVFKERQKSCGVILIRLPEATTDWKIKKLSEVIESKKENLSRVFTTITEKQIRSKLLPKSSL